MLTLRSTLRREACARSRKRSADRFRDADSILSERTMLYMRGVWVNEWDSARTRATDDGRSSPSGRSPPVRPGQPPTAFCLRTQTLYSHYTYLNHLTCLPLTLWLSPRATRSSLLSRRFSTRVSIIARADASPTPHHSLHANADPCRAPHLRLAQVDFCRWQRWSWKDDDVVFARDPARATPRVGPAHVSPKPRSHSTPPSELPRLGGSVRR